MTSDIEERLKPLMELNTLESQINKLKDRTLIIGQLLIIDK